MLWVLCIFQLISYMACGCIIEERIALMHVRSSFVEGNSAYFESWGQRGSAFLESWGQSDDCCSWEGVRCNSKSRVSDLDINFFLYYPPNSYIDECIWNMDLTIVSWFHELQ
jgi:hypothetical protein